MGHVKTFLIAAPVALGLLAAPAAHAEWRGGHDRGGWSHGGWGHGGWEHREGGWGYRGGYEHRGYGVPLAGVLLGLGAAAAIGGIVASQQPGPVEYGPPPGYYYPEPAYYYQAQPGYTP